ncbi:hypothetical protein TCAP_01589 [Tolypocladium capitatum]|uniref:Secreted protein n=1 Tax=Tolypocladium capitatum TaxID=45235 RepID=A0A2K3QLU8_9HYPO|nr:hypothetical protein TCAP_01589 [Tolypocladium capitatum]
MQRIIHLFSMWRRLFASLVSSGPLGRERPLPASQRPPPINPPNVNAMRIRPRPACQRFARSGTQHLLSRCHCCQGCPSGGDVERVLWRLDRGQT